MGKIPHSKTITGVGISLMFLMGSMIALDIDAASRAKSTDHSCSQALDQKPLAEEIKAKAIMKKANALYANQPKEWKKLRDEAKKLYKLAAEKGSPTAYYWLAWQGVKNRHHYVEQAAMRGHVGALRDMLGWLFFHDNGVLTNDNIKKAWALYRTVLKLNPAGLSDVANDVALETKAMEVLKWAVEGGDVDISTFLTFLKKTQMTSIRPHAARRPIIDWQKNFSTTCGS